MKAVLKALWWPLRLLLFALVPSLLTGAAFLLYADSGSAVLLRALTAVSDGTIRARSVAGPLAGPLSLDGFVYEDRYVRVEVDGAGIDWNPYALLLRTLSVRELSAARVFIAIKPQPPDPEQKDVLTQLPFALRLHAAKIGRYEMDIEGAPLRFDGVELGAHWSGDVIAIDRLRLDYAPVGALDLIARLRMQPRSLAILDAQLRAPAPLQLSGEIGYGNGFRAEARWRRLQWPLQGEAQLTSPSGTLSAEGRWDDYRYRLETELHGAGLASALQAQGRGDLQALQLDMLEARLLGGTLRADGALAWSPNLQATLQGQVQQIDPGAVWSEWPGRIGGRFRAALREEDGSPALDLELDLRDSQLRGWPLALTGRGHYRDGVMKLEQADLRSGASRLRLQGRASAPLDLALQLDSPDFAQLLPQLRGRGSLEAKLGGSLQHPQLRAGGAFERIGYGDYAAAQLKLDADLHPQRTSRLKLAARELDAGVRIETATLEASGLASRHQLRLQARTEAGDVALELQGGLDAEYRRWTGALTAGRGELDDLPDWELEEPAALALSAQAVTLEPACWRSEGGRACAQFRRNGNSNRLAFRLEDWAFAYFRSFLPPQWTLSGSASGTGRLQFGDAGLTGAQLQLQTTAGQLRVGSQLALAFEPSLLEASEEADGLELKLRVPMSEGGIEADARLAPGATLAKRRLGGRLAIDFRNLAPLRMLTAQVETVSGTLRGEFALAGTAGRPRSDGRLHLDVDSLRLAAPGIELRELQAELRSSAASDLLQLSASAQSGEGELKMSGQTDPQATSKVLSLHITGSNFLAANLPQARVWVSPDLRFDLARDRADLSGEVQVPRAELLPRSFAQGISPSRDQIIVGSQGEDAQAGLLKIYSNVRIVLGDNVKFDGFGLKSKLQGALTATDEPGRPTQGRGEIRLVDGRYKAYGQDLNIETGRLLFNGGLITDPAIELRAVRHPAEDVSVGIYARGTLASPLFTLYSTPDMPQDQQLSWLVLGRAIEESASAGERNAVSDAALSLGMSGGTLLTQKLGAGLRLDEVSIGARPGQTADQAQLTIGKYLSPKLYVSYGIGVFQPGHTFRLLYDIGRHFKLSTESGVESGGDLLYSIERD